MREIEHRLLRELGEWLPLLPDPFEAVGRRLGLSAGEVIEVLERLQRQKIVRRFGAVVNHFAMGYTANALVVWELGEDEIDGAGESLAYFPFVSHCYWRAPARECPYNLYAMVHGADGEEIAENVRRLEEAVGTPAAGVFHTLKEHKKKSLGIADVDEEEQGIYKTGFTG